MAGKRRLTAPTQIMHDRCIMLVETIPQQLIARATILLRFPRNERFAPHRRRDYRKHIEYQLANRLTISSNSVGFPTTDRIQGVPSSCPHLPLACCGTQSPQSAWHSPLRRTPPN
jgi:hypothetical protein